MGLNTTLAKPRRDELVKEATVLLVSSYPYIIEEGLENQMHNIAMGHVMSRMGRDGLAKELPAKAVEELDALFALMGIRALDEFVLESQAAAISKAVSGENVALGPVAEIEKLVKEKIRLVEEAEALQKKIVLAAAGKKKIGGFAAKRRKLKKKIREYTEKISNLAVDNVAF